MAFRGESENRVMLDFVGNCSVDGVILLQNTASNMEGGVAAKNRQIFSGRRRPKLPPQLQ